MLDQICCNYGTKKKICNYLDACAKTCVSSTLKYTRSPMVVFHWLSSNHKLQTIYDVSKLTRWDKLLEVHFLSSSILHIRGFVVIYLTFYCVCNLLYKFENWRKLHDMFCWLYYVGRDLWVVSAMVQNLAATYGVTPLSFSKVYLWANCQCKWSLKWGKTGPWSNNQKQLPMCAR